MSDRKSFSMTTNKYKYTLTISLCLVVALFSCSNDPDFIAKNIVGDYEGTVHYQKANTLDTLLVFPCRYSFLSNGEAMWERLDGEDMETSNWYINAKTNTITFEVANFFGITVNDVSVWTKDSLVFRGEEYVNINGIRGTKIRTVKLRRED